MMSIGDVVRYVPGITAHPGREQSRPGGHPRQQLVGRLLRQRRARRRAVLPRPLQPRARRGAEGTERHDLRPRRRRRRDQPRDQGGRLHAAARGHRCRAARTATSASPPTSTSRSATSVAFRLNGMYENSDSFRDYVGLERYGVNPTADRHAPATRHEDDARLRVLPRHARRRSRHPVLPGPARGRRRRRPTSAIPTTATCGARVNLGSATDRAPGSAASTLRNRTLVRRLRSRLSELRARRRDGRPDARSR